MDKVIIAIGILAALMLLFVGSYAINAKTKVPEGCENLEDLSACESCNDHSCLIKARLEEDKRHDQQ